MELTIYAKLRMAFKVVELVLSCICIGILVHSGILYTHEGGAYQVLLPLTFAGFIIITAGLVIGFLIHQRVPKKIDLLYTKVGLALFLACGIILLKDFSQLKHELHSHSSIDYRPSVDPKTVNMALATGSLAIINAIVFLVDIGLSYRDVSESYTPH